MEITITTNAAGWLARFANTARMPCGEWIPLPFNLLARFEMVARDLKRRFPGAVVFYLPPKEPEPAGALADVADFISRNADAFDPT